MPSTVPQRERYTARINIKQPPSRKERWEALAAEDNISLTRLLERAMEREEQVHARRRVTR